MSIQTLAIETTPTTTAVVTKRLTENEAQRVAKAYIADQIDPAFEVVSGAHYFNKSLGREVWRFYVRSVHGPIGLVQLDACNGAIVALSDKEIQAMHEKAAIAAARTQGILPINEQGFIVGEYAKRCATAYLSETLSLFFGAVDPVFISGNPPLWQVTIAFKMYEIGPFTVGMLKVDASNGEILSLTASQIKEIQERASVIIGRQKSATTRG